MKFSDVCQVKWFLLFALLAFAPQVFAEGKADLETVSTPDSIQIEVAARKFTPQEVKLLQELEQRRIDLDRREQALELRERLVDLAEKRLTHKADTMDQLRGDISNLLKNLSDKEEEELIALAKIYEVMKPAAAANVLNKVDHKIVFDLFKRMKQKSTAKIMEKMSTGKARLISEMMAEKSELPVFE